MRLTAPVPEPGRDHGRHHSPARAKTGTLAAMSQPQPARRSKQQRLAAAVMRAGVLDGLRRIHDRGRRPVLILAYHRVATVAQPQTYPLDLGIISASAEEFEAQMRALR